MHMQDSSTTADVLVEVAGTLAGLALPGFEYGPFLVQHQLHGWLCAMLVAGNADDDIILECVMLAGTVCDASSASLVAHAGLVRRGKEICRDIRRMCTLAAAH